MTEVRLNTLDIHQLEDLDLKTISEDGQRFYVDDKGDRYPSVTTVVGLESRKHIQAWRKRVGEEVATHIASKAAVRGSKVHKMCEDWLSQDFSFETWEKHKKDFLPYTLFNELKNQRFEFITDVYAQEICLYSDKYRVAGRADCIANYQHQLSVIDFKTSTNERKDSYNENYYIQTAAYALMFEEITGQPIDQIVILVVTENGTVQEFIKDKKDYIPLLEETLDEWYKTCK